MIVKRHLQHFDHVLESVGLVLLLLFSKNYLLPHFFLGFLGHLFKSFILFSFVAKPQ